MPDFQVEIKTNFEAWRPGPVMGMTAEKAGERLRELTRLTVSAVPKAPISQLKHNNTGEDGAPSSWP